MLGRLILGMAVTVAILVALGYSRKSTRERVLASAGPVDRDAPDDFSVTDSGLRYRVLREGQGSHPQPTDTITVNYAGWLDGGTQFDSSYKSQPLVKPLSSLVPGWIEGLQLVGQGGMIELEVPSELGYGARGSGSEIPPDATLHFIVELLVVEPGNEPAEAGARDSDTPEGFTATDSGLKYRILRKSDGKHPSIIDTVTVHYKGWLDDGTVFDSSYRRAVPSTLTLGGVIPGWTEGLTYVGAGGMIELEVPSELGYGKEGMPGIPPHATLHFLVELLEVH